MNGETYNRLKVYGDSAVIGKTYPVFVPQNNMSMAFVITGGESGSGETVDYNDLSNKPQINGITLSGNKTSTDLKIVYDDTTAHWNSQTTFVPQKGAIIIYSDYATVDNQNVPNVKIGDGLAYVVDLPFVSDDLRQTVLNHISDSTIHITATERTSWNNKVTCDVELISGTDYNLLFSTN